MKNSVLLVCLSGLTWAFGAELARFEFEEAEGAYAEDSISCASASFMPGVKWARGSFGTALGTGTESAFAHVEALKGVDGSRAVTLFLRFRKESAGHGRYPCLLSSDDWCGTGGTLLFLSGTSLSVRFRADAVETAWMVFPRIPERKWSSLAFVVNRPEVIVYADGRPVAKGTWDHPFLLGDFRLGGWNGDSFGGLLDDLRIWNEALPADRIAALAAERPAGDANEEIRFLGQGGKPLARFDDPAVSLVFDSSGCVSSLRETVSGRELVAQPVSFLQVFRENGTVLSLPKKLERLSERRFRGCFPHGRGTVEFSVSPFEGGWIFTLEDLDVPSATRVEFGCVHPSCSRWKGAFANAWSDEASAVAVRSCDLAGAPSFRAEGLFVEAEVARARGLRVALAAGPRAGFQKQLQAMTCAAGVPRSDCGGAWSMGSEQARRSYVFASVTNGDVDYWINLARRSGFSIIHLNDYSWSGLLGPYPVNENAFPGGMEGLRRAADRVHAAGLQLGIHSLTGCINPNADWIHPVCDTNLISDAVYTLAKPLEPGDTELVVNEKPVPRHSTVFTYMSSGNVLQIGGELLQYTGIRREKPYGFTGLTRGAFKTLPQKGTIAAGTSVKYLHQCYIAFYPNPDSPLADRLAGRLAEVYNTCGLDDFYFDGSEGMGSRYAIDAMRHKIFSRFQRNNGHSPSIEASCNGANNWWFQARMGTVDHAVWGMKRFHDAHIRWAVEDARKANFLEPQMGWWAPRTATAAARGHFPDEMEYFAGKNAGHDAAMAIQGIASMRPLPIGVKRQLAILGWYEHARLARVFTDEARTRLAEPGAEARLRQGPDGVWRLTDVESTVHRVDFPGTEAWTVPCAAEAAAALRVEALQGVADAAAGVAFVTPDDLAKMTCGRASGVDASVKAVDGDAEHGPVMRLRATNAGAERTGAWARAERAFDFPGFKLPGTCAALGAWVKGDGSGALLNFQVRSPHEYIGGISEHYLRLDFTGWRYVTVLLRERDAAEYSRYQWPYGGLYSIYRDPVTVEHLSSFAVYLNDIPKGGTVEVDVGEVKAFPTRPLTLAQAKVCVNGESFAVPFDLASGEYAELDEGAWTRYSAQGTAIARQMAEKTPRLRAGTNVCSFARAAAGRAEVTVFAKWHERPAFKPLTAEMRKRLSVEAMAPFEYQPARGLTGPSVVPIRPGERAVVSAEVTGPASNLVFRLERKGKAPLEVKAAVNLGAGISRVFELGELDATAAWSFTADVPSGEVCVVELLKDYR